MSSEPLPHSELHVITRRGDRRAFEVCRRQAESGVRVEVVLAHDAVLETEESLLAMLGERARRLVLVMASAEDAERRRVGERWALLGYREIVARLTATARATSW